MEDENLSEKLKYVFLGLFILIAIGFGRSHMDRQKNKLATETESPDVAVEEVALDSAEEAVTEVAETVEAEVEEVAQEQAEDVEADMAEVSAEEATEILAEVMSEDVPEVAETADALEEGEFQEYAESMADDSEEFIDDYLEYDSDSSVSEDELAMEEEAVPDEDSYAYIKVRGESEEMDAPQEQEESVFGIFAGGEDEPQEEAMDVAMNQDDVIEENIMDVVNESATEVMAGGSSLCQTAEYGVKYWCDTQWESQDASDGEMFVISSSPKVTLEFAHTDKKIVFLGQVNTFLLSELGDYKAGFRTERVKFAGREAIVVKGFDKNNPETRYQDYYFIHDNKLAGVKFALSPKEQWDEGKFLIKKVADSFVPLDK
jgi:hypothetical protein